MGKHYTGELYALLDGDNRCLVCGAVGLISYVDDHHHQATLVLG
jgi:hypothetical protein